MPYQEADPSDPHVLVGVSLPGGRDDVRRMAEVLVEEFAALGFEEERILRLFRHPGYVAAHRAWSELGEAEITRIVRECAAPWARLRVVVSEPAGEPQPAIAADLVGLGSRARRRGPDGR
jgi:hypothetical protein